MLGYWIVMGMVALTCILAITSYLRNRPCTDEADRGASDPCSHSF